MKLKAKKTSLTASSVLYMFLIVTPTFAVEAPDLHGFVEARAGMRTQNDPHEDNRNLTETRAQLDALTYFEKFELQFRGDLYYDELENRLEKVDLESGHGFFDLRELNVLFSPVEWADVKAGRQILTWGTGDLLFINDLFPKDWNSFLLGRDEEYLKAPSDALYTSFFPPFANIDLVYTPRFDSDRYVDGKRLSYWNPALQRIAGKDAEINPDRRDKWFKDQEIASRIYRNIYGYETALYFYHGFWKSPEGYDPTEMRPYFPELNVYGASTKGEMLGGIFNLEAGYYDSREDRSGTDPDIPNSETRFLAGYQKELARNLTVGVQYYVEWMMNHDDYIESMPVDTTSDEFRHVTTLRVTQLLMNQNLILSIFTFFSPNERDAYLRPSATYKISDHWAAGINGNFFFGERDYTFFGQFRRNSNLNMNVRYNF